MYDKPSPVLSEYARLGWHIPPHDPAELDDFPSIRDFLRLRLRIPILDVQRICGWSDYETLRKIYTHLDETDSRAATASLSAYFSHELLTEK